MNKFEFFCFIKNVLVAAKNAGWEHQPEYDRYICDDVTLCFSRLFDGEERAIIDIEFELCAVDVLGSAVVKFKNCQGCRTMRAKDIVFPNFDKLFDPKCWNAHGKFIEE